MGLGGQAIDAIGREHAYRPITGDVLFIGRQTVYFSPQDLARRLRDHCREVDESAIEVDGTTLNRNLQGELATDRSIFRALGLPPEHIKALDVSPYEGAEIIHDLNQPIPDALRATADFIVDGSTLDNVFDPAMTLRNFAGLLRSNGRLLMINAWNVRDSAYTLSSPSWYLDYFVANGFADCKVYVCTGADSGTNIYWLDPSLIGEGRGFVRTPILATWQKRPFILVLAEKSDQQQEPVVPTQADYRGREEWQRFHSTVATMQTSPRPHLVRSIGRLLPRRRSWRSWGFVWIDGDYQPRRLTPFYPPASQDTRALALRQLRALRDIGREKAVRLVHHSFHLARHVFRRVLRLGGNILRTFGLSGPRSVKAFPSNDKDRPTETRHDSSNT